MQASLDIVQISAAGYCLGLEARQVRGLYPYTPHAQALGLWDWLGLPALADDRLPPQHSLVVQPPGVQTGVLLHIPGRVDWRALPADCIHPVPALVRQRSALTRLRAVAVLPDGDWVWLLGAAG